MGIYLSPGNVRVPPIPHLHVNMTTQHVNMKNQHKLYKLKELKIVQMKSIHVNVNMYSTEMPCQQTQLMMSHYIIC